MSETVRLDMWADIACPWCFIGQTRLNRALEVEREVLDEATGIASKKVIDFRQQTRGADLKPRIALRDKKGEIITLTNAPPGGWCGWWCGWCDGLLVVWVVFAAAVGSPLRARRSFPGPPPSPQSRHSRGCRGGGAGEKWARRGRRCVRCLVVIGGDWPMLCRIAQDFSSVQADISTRAVLLFPERSSLEIVRRMLGDEVSEDKINEIEADALGEIGNIIINSCMNSLAHIFGREMTGTLPDVRTGKAEELFGREEGDESAVLLARIGMRMATRRISGHVIFMMDMQSLQVSIQQIRQFFGIATEAA